MPQCLTTISQSDEILILPLASNRSPPPPQRITGPVVENQFEDGDASADGNQREICFCHFFHMEVRPSAYSDEAGSDDDLGILSVLVTVMVMVVVMVMMVMDPGARHNYDHYSCTIQQCLSISNKKPPL